MESSPRGAIPALSDTHAELVRLAAQAPTYNFDAGLLVMEIGTLLASLAAPSERLDGWALLPDNSASLPEPPAAHRPCLRDDRRRCPRALAAAAAAPAAVPDRNRRARAQE